MFGRMLILAVFFLFPVLAYADSYDFATNQLTVSSLTLGNIKFNNVIITAGSLVSVGGSASAQNAECGEGADTYDLLTNQLTIDCLTLLDTSYTNVVITIGSIVSEGSSSKVAVNSHYGVEDCISCHTTQHSLLIGGTVFSASNFNKTCGGATVQLLNPSTKAVMYELNSYSSGEHAGKGNFGIRRKYLSSVTPGVYIARVVSSDRTTLAESAPTHFFNGDINNTDISNRYSCNVCHTLPSTNGAIGPIYVQQNGDKCY